MKLKLLCFLFFGSIFLRAQDVDSLLQQYQSYPNDTAKINLLYNKGFTLRNSDLETAVKFSQACYQVASQVNNKYYLAKVENLIGTLKYQTGFVNEAIQALQDALQLRVQIADSLGQITSLINLGNVYSDLNRNATAFACYEKSLRLAQSIHNDKWVKGALVCIASLQIKMKMYAAAEGNYQTLLNWESTKKEYEILAICYYNLGICKFNLKDTLAAESYQLQALDILESSEDENGQADCYTALAENYLAKKDFKNSYSSLQKALQISLRNNYREGIVSAWKVLSLYYVQTKDFKEAYFYLAKHDSVLAENKNALLNTSVNLWEIKNDASAKNEASLFSVKNIFQVIIIGALILILIVVSIRMGNEKAKEK